MRHETVRALALIAGGVATGMIGWSGNPLALPMAMVFPALWAFSPSRLLAACVSAGYFLAASRGLPQGFANFYGSQLALGIALWSVASLAFVGVQTALWTSYGGRHPPLRYAITAVLMSVPPFGIVGWAHPITLAAAAILGGFWAWSAATWTPPNMPEDWIGVDTQFLGAAGQYAAYDQQLATISRVKSAAADGADVVILPESAAGLWTPTTERLWRQQLSDSDFTVIAGAAVVDQDGYDNVMMRVSAGGGEVIYRERMPVPVSMWQPWQAWTGQGGGAQAHFFANPIVHVDDVAIAPLICYEQLLLWPIIQSMLYRPDVVVATGNGWWTAGTSIVAIQKASVEAWASLFRIPLVKAFNH